MFRRLSRENGERGSALMAVIGVMAVLLIITLTVTSSSLQALTITTSTRAGVQAQAAAEAGIDFAVAHLGTPETCPQAPMESSSTAPYFTARIVYLSADDSEVNCAEAVQIKIVSTGTATKPGQASSSTEGIRTTEAVFEFDAAGTELQPSGAAIYSYSGGSLAQSSQFSSTDGSVPEIQIQTGTPSCKAVGSAKSAVTFNLVVANDGMMLDGSCTLSGNVWASGAVDLNSSTHVSGNLVSQSLVANSSVNIQGSVWTTGSVKLMSSVVIHGLAVTDSLRLESSSKILGDAWSAGNTTLDGGSSRIFGHLSTSSFTGSGEDVEGGISYDGSEAPPAIPVAPVVSDWVSVGYSASDWPAFTHLTTISSNGICTRSDVQTAIKDVSVPLIIDATGCGKGLTLDGALALANDVVIFSRDFDLRGSIGSTASAKDPNLWLITPDDSDKSKCKNPDSAGNGPAPSVIAKSFSLSEVAAMLYTPCKITLGEGASWRGQFYGGSVDTLTDSALEYVYVGLPGDGNFNSGDGGASGSEAGGAKTGLGKQVSVRDRNAGE